MAEAHDREFAEFYAARRAALLRFLTARLNSADEAEEVLQEAFMQYRNARVKTSINNPNAFLMTIAANLSTDRMRQNNSRRQREQAWSDTQMLMGGDLAPVQHRVAEANEEIDRVIRLLAGCSRSVREAFILHRFKGLSHRQVAKQLGLSKSTVEKHIIQVMKLLMKERR